VSYPDFALPLMHEEESTKENPVSGCCQWL